MLPLFQLNENKIKLMNLQFYYFKKFINQLHDIFYDKCIYNKNLKIFYKYFENNESYYKKNTIYINFEDNVDITKLFFKILKFYTIIK